MSQYFDYYAPQWIHALPEAMKRQLLRGESILLGGKMYGVCRKCRHVVCLNKTLFGSLHLCAGEP